MHEYNVVLPCAVDGESKKLFSRVILELELETEMLIFFTEMLICVYQDLNE
jgi:hypothetical protein